METRRPGRISERIEEQVDVPAPGEGIREHVAEEVTEAFVPRVMKESVQVVRWIPQESIQQCSGQEIVPGAMTNCRGVVSVENEVTMGWSSLQTEKVLGDTPSKQVESAKVTGARLVSARHARKRQRKIASRSRVRFGDEEQSVVGTLESPAADSECLGTLESPVVDPECPPRSGLLRRWMENDFGEKFTEVVEAKRFKQVRAWGGVHMYQSIQERPGAQHRDKDIGRTDEHIVNNWKHTQREAMASKVEKQVWMQFEGKSRPWDIRFDEGGDEMEKRGREMKGMGDVGMHMVSEGRVVSWNDK